MLGLIPAAGKGTRFHELGKQYPKCILPFKEKPLIVHTINKMIESGCDEIIVGVNHHKDMVEEVVDRYFPQEDIYCVDVGNTKSLPETLKEMTASKEHDGVLIILSDIFVKSKIYTNSPHSFVSVNAVNDYKRWCMVESQENGEIIEFHDKVEIRPDTVYAANGIYFLTDYNLFRSTFNLLNYNSGEELQLSQILELYKCDLPLYEALLNITELGTYEDYIQNRGMKNSRSFNEVVVKNNTVVKSSEQVEKIRSEYHWFQDAPYHVKKYLPNIIDFQISNGIAGYEMEKIQSPTLREMYLFLDGDLESWERIFNDIYSFTSFCSDHNNVGGTHHSFIRKMVNKTFERLNVLESDQTLSKEEIDCSYIYTRNRIIQTCENIGWLLEQDLVYRPDSFAHGDLCFSNIMWSPTGMKVIDPRGEYYGSIYYEYAKLYHSVIGKYDFIDAELYDVDEENGCTLNDLYDNGKYSIEQLFMSHIKDRFNEYEIMLIEALCATLFLSMIPLHNHNIYNQKLFLEQFFNIEEKVNASINSIRLG